MNVEVRKDVEITPHEAELAGAQAFMQGLRDLTPRAPVTPTLVVLNGAVFVGMVLSGVSVTSPSVRELLVWGANFGPLTSNGDWLRLLTSTFVHIGLIHVAFNMYVLLDAGRLVERLVGSTGFLVAYLVSGLIGALTSMATQPWVVSAGASGAVFGIYGVLLGYIAVQRGTVPRQDVLRLARIAGMFLLYNVIYAFTRENVDVAAHFGGLGAGFLAGLVLALPLEAAALRRRLPRAVALMALGAGTVVLGGAALSGFVVDLDREIARFAETEGRVLATWRDLVGAAERGELADEEVVRIVREDMLPAWHAAAAEFGSVPMTGVPASQAELHQKLVAYMEAREQSFHLLAEGLDQGNEQLLADAATAQGRAEQIATALGATTSE